MITDYATLQVEAAKEAQRRDLASMMPSLIQRAEAAIFRALTLHQMDTTATGMTSGPTIPFPAGAVAVERISLEINGRDRSLTYIAPGSIEPQTDGVCQPTGYVVEDGAIRLVPSPVGPYAYTVYYAANLEPLSDANPTNWLLLNAPDVYLYRTCVQIGVYTHDDALIQRHTQFYDAALAALRGADERKRIPRRGGLRLRVRGAV